MNETLESEFAHLKSLGLVIDLTRGKPGADQLDLSNAILSMDTPTHASSGLDIRNYGEPLGIMEARELGASLLSSPVEQTLVGEQSSLLLIYQLILANYLFGLKTPWSKQENLKFICPVPGFDRHFRLLEDFGIEVLTLPLNGAGIDIQEFKDLLSQHNNIKGLIAVPRHSNPSGDIYTDENILSLMEAGKAYSDEFLFIFDHAYLVHDFSECASQTPTWELAVKAGAQRQTAVLSSFSKVTFGGGGLSFATAGKELFELLVKQRAGMIVCPDKANQLRHVLFLKNKEGIERHMKNHAALIKPKFEAAFHVLDAIPEELGSYHKPTGGYFISFDTHKPIAARTIELCKEAGVLITPAGSTFPGFQDPKDSNIRLAPTFINLEDLKLAMQVFITALKIADQELSS